MYMTSIIEFNIIITFIIISHNKCTPIITSFVFCITDMIFLMYFRVSPQLESLSHMSLIHPLADIFHNV